MMCPFCHASINVSPDAIHQVGLKPDNLRRWIERRRADPRPKCVHCLTSFVPASPENAQAWAESLSGSRGVHRNADVHYVVNMALLANRGVE